MVKNRKIEQQVSEIADVIAIQEATHADGLRERLEEIKSRDDVIGYILRNTTSASVDLKEPENIIDYAILSSTSIDAGKEFSELFDLGEFQNIIVEGKTAKTLSLTIGENRISIFMEKNAHAETIMKKLRTS